jgi:kelch-like protein 2/3
MSYLQSLLYRKWQQPLIAEIFEKLQELLILDKHVKFCWVPSHIGIQGNEKADMAAKAALQRPVVTNIKIPYTDFKQSIVSHFTTLWQNQWNNSAFNKLHEIKPTIGITKVPRSFTRRDEVVLHRVRIGHTYLTHSFLLKTEPAPECNPCQCVVSVKHILLDCPLLNNTRFKHFTSTNLHQLFTSVQPTSIINYLRDTNYYGKL